MGVKQTLAANLVLHHDYRKGTLVDQSGNGNDGAFTGTPYWSNSNCGRVLSFNGVNERIVVSAAASLNITGVITISVWAKIKANDVNQRFLSKGSDSYQTYILATDRIAFGDDSGFKEVTASFSNTGYHMFTFVHNGDNNFAGLSIYVDGVLRTDIATSGSFNGWGDSSALDLYIASKTSTGFMDGSIREVLIFNTDLSSQQISELYEKSLQEAHIGILPKRNFQAPELMAYNEFQRDLEWTKGTGWTIANGKASSDGSQVAVSDLTQAVAVVGKTYTIEYSLSNLSGGEVTGLAGDSVGASRTANGVYVDVIVATTNTNLGLQAGTSFVGDIDYVRIREGFKLNYRNTFEDAPVTVTALGSGDVGDFHIDSGTWQISDDGTDKWLECVTSGIAYTSMIKAFGTWQWDVSKAEGSVIRMHFAAEALDLVNTYEILCNSSEDFRLRKNQSGITTLFQTNAAEVPVDTKFTVRVTRNFAGVFNVYVDGVLVVASSSGSNPVTNIDLTDLNFVAWDLDAGDKISNIKFWEGVVTPTDLP